MADLIKNAGDIIAKYNPDLAACWLTQPFRREQIACAFSRGFVKNAQDDPPAFCMTILKVALADKKMRQLSTS